MKKSIAAIVTAVAVLIGCSDNTGKTAAVQTEEKPAPIQTGAMPSGHPPIPASVATIQNRNAPSGTHAPAMRTSGRGIIRAVHQAGGYTYVEVETDGNSQWIAGRQAKLEVNQQVAWRDGAIMRNFHSKTLDRLFPELMFISDFLTPDAQLQQKSQSKGVVMSVNQAAGYSYLSVDTEQGSKWLALPERTLSKGDRVAWMGGSQMRNFHSKSLDKTFDTILFLSSIDVQTR